MIDYRRLFLNLFMFFLGILLPLLAFQNAFATYYIWDFWAQYVSSGCYDCSRTQTLADGTIRYECVGVPCDSPSVTHGPGVCEVEICSSEPSTCSNGVIDSDESGVDCGGSCDSVCDSETCPPGTQDLGLAGCFPVDPDWDISKDAYGNCAGGTVDVSTDPSVTICVPTSYVPDSSGNCGDGMAPAFELSGGQSLCGPSPVAFSSDDEPPEVDPFNFDQPSFEKKSVSFIETESSEEITDNPDGTSTGVKTKEVRDSDDNLVSSETTTTDYSGSGGSGDITGTSTARTSVIPEEENPENYNLKPPQTEYDGEIAQEDIPDKKSIADLLTDAISNNPLTNIITGSGLDLSGSATQLSWQYKGKTIVFDLSDRGGVLSAMGTLLVFLAGIAAYFIIVGRE